MDTISISAVTVRDRQRKAMLPTKKAELRESILQFGLFHPILVHLEGDTVLVLDAGGRRLEVIRDLAAEKLSIRHNNMDVPLGDIPYSFTSVTGDVNYKKIELFENLHREELAWQDRDRALYEIVQMERAENPAASMVLIASNVIAKGPIGDIRTVSSLREALREAEIIAPLLHDPAVSKARNSHEAFSIIMAREEAALIAERHRRLMSKAPVAEDVRIQTGSCYDIMKTLADNSVDLICTDPPYGAVNAGAAGFRERTKHHHNYDDSPEAAMEALKFLLVEGWRVTKNPGNLLIFGDIDYFQFFKTQASMMGWTPFRTPIIWQKSKSEGMAPWARGGFRRTYEAIFFATKGSRGLFSNPLDILDVKRVHRSERIYGAQKPLDLLMQLIEAATFMGGFVLDPFCGSGSCLVAAKKLRRKGLGIERDPAVADLATNFLLQHEATDAASDDTDATDAPESV